MAIRRLVVKVGTSSMTDISGVLRMEVVESLVSQIARAREMGIGVVMVVSGAIALGLSQLGLARPQPTEVLQAASGVGQVQMVASLREIFHLAGMEMAQLLLAPHDFGDRQQYLHARQTLESLFALGVVPVINENDAIASEEIRFGDNDRLAALVAHLVYADLLLLLTDLEGVYTEDPRASGAAQFIPVFDVEEKDRVLATGSGTDRGSGGMASKLQAAEIAARSGVDCMIASAATPEVVAKVAAGEHVLATFVPRKSLREPARRLWIAYATNPEGRLVVDEGAKRALLQRNASLLAVGIRSVEGEFLAHAIVEVAGEDGKVFAKGVVRTDSKGVLGAASEVIHRDDLVTLVS